MGGASGKVLPKSMEVVRPSTRSTLAVEVEGDGGAEGLVAVDEDDVVGGDLVGAFEGLDGLGEVYGREHGVEADEGDVRGDEEDACWWRRW